ncbi:hypothetical protein LguiA_016813 [Lonicera macranthoides]
MAFILPTYLSPPSLLTNQQQSSSSSKDKPPTIHLSTTTNLTFSPLTLTKLQPPPPPPPTFGVNQQAPPEQDKQQQQRDDFYVNLGLAVRTLREDLPSLFTKDLNYHIYRDDITFLDPLNKFTGIENYKLIFWALRFHGRILFRDISLEVFRVWQPSENVILIRWNLKGVPRVPWEAKGHFQGTSRYKLDRNGKIYQHKVDNLAFNFPHQLKPTASSVLDLVSASCPPATPNPTFSSWAAAPPVRHYSSSWLEFYRAVRGTLDLHQPSLATRDCLFSCS